LTRPLFFSFVFTVAYPPEKPSTKDGGAGEPPPVDFSPARHLLASTLSGGVNRIRWSRRPY
jgi:hypothetical protein